MGARNTAGRVEVARAPMNTARREEFEAAIACFEAIATSEVGIVQWGGLSGDIGELYGFANWKCNDQKVLDYLTSV